MSKFTPGPWKVSHGCMPGDSGFSIGTDNAASSGNVKITAECWPCTIVSEDHREEVFANARLIEQAPRLLKALESLCGEKMPTRDDFEEAREAIKAATGG